MLSGLWFKAHKTMWIAIARGVGLLHGQLGTSLAVRYYAQAGMHIAGRPTYIAPNAWFDSSEKFSLITLHEGCNISRDVRILTHDWSPFCIAASLGRKSGSRIGRLRHVEIGPHAFIGLGVTLMPGAVIGRGAVIGAGAVVRGRVPDYAIAIGNPSRVVGDSRDYLRAKFPEEWATLGNGHDGAVS